MTSCMRTSQSITAEQIVTGGVMLVATVQIPASRPHRDGTYIDTQHHLEGNTKGSAGPPQPR